MRSAFNVLYPMTSIQSFFFSLSLCFLCLHHFHLRNVFICRLSCFCFFVRQMIPDIFSHFNSKCCIHLHGINLFTAKQKKKKANSCLMLKIEFLLRWTFLILWLTIPGVYRLIQNISIDCTINKRNKKKKNTNQTRVKW